MESLKTLAAPTAGLITSILAFIGFFAKPATQKGIEGINKNIGETRKDIIETRTIVQGEAAKTRLSATADGEATRDVIREEIAKLKASMSPDEAKSFEEAFRDVLSSSDARKAPARDSLKAGRIEEGADQILKIARQEAAASADMACTTQNSYREAGALFYPINTAKALEAYVGAIDARSQRPWDHIYASRLYERFGNLPKAELVLKSALNLSLSLRDKSVIFNELGNISVSKGDLSTAAGYYKDGLNIAMRHAEDDPSDAGYQRDLSVSYERLGDVSRGQGDLSAAAGYYNEGLEIRRFLAADDPSDAGYQRDLSISYNKLGEISVSQGDLSAAAGYFKEGLDIAKHLAADDPSNASYQRDLSISYEKLGDVSHGQGDLSTAEDYYKEGLDIAKRLAADDPSNAGYQRDLTVSYDRLGDVLQDQGDYSAAAGYYKDGLEIRKGLAADDPSNAGYQRDLSLSYERLGSVSREQGDLSTAAGYYNDGLEIAKRLAADDHSNADYQRDLIVSYSRLAAAEPDHALSWWKEAKTVCDQMIAKNQLAPKDAYFPDTIARKIAELE